MPALLQKHSALTTESKNGDKKETKEMGMNYERQLAIPAELKEMYPLTAKMNAAIQERRAKLESIFEGRDNKLILIIGPCSADNEDSVMD